MIDGETTLKTSDECDMLIFEMACADFNEHKDNRSSLQTAYSNQYKIFQNCTRTDMPSRVNRMSLARRRGFQWCNKDPLRQMYSVLVVLESCPLERKPNKLEQLENVTKILFEQVYSALKFRPFETKQHLFLNDRPIY